MGKISEKKMLPLIIGAGVIIPTAVAILFFAPKLELGFNIGFLPKLNAIINASTSIILIMAFIAIKNKNIKLHKALMTSAILLSIVFLLSYITYHASTESTKFEGVGTIKSVYYFILFSHILLAIAIVPLVLISYVRALSEKFDKHRQIARYTLPLWLYVTITGVVVYLMISPYYQH